MVTKYLVFNHGEYDDKSGGFEDLAGIFDSFDEAERFVHSLEGGYSKLEANIWSYDCMGEPDRKAQYEHRYVADPHWAKVQMSEDGWRRIYFRFIDGQWHLED